MGWSGPQRWMWHLGLFASCLGCGSPGLKLGAGVDAARPAADGPMAGRGPGQPCTMPGDCLTGQCADGVCCEQSCSHPCFSCLFPGAQGRCLPLPTGIPPRAPEACRTTDPSTCGLDGTCDGQGDCRRYVAGTVCRRPLCEQEVYRAASLCDGQGGCAEPLTFACAPFGCDPDGGACRATCQTDHDCAPSYRCSNNSCGSDRAPTCRSDDECVSGFCRQSLCCQSSCDDPCMACDLPGHLGQCLALADGGCPGRFDASAGQ